jgi:hypothetical protein
MEDNELLWTWQRDMEGNLVLDRNGQPVQDGGVYDTATGQMIPGTHFVLKTDAKGQADWGYQWEDPAILKDARTWEQRHIRVVTGWSGQRVVGEVEIQNAPAIGLRITTTDGTQKILKDYGRFVGYAPYVDGYGNTVRAYSVDGVTWVLATGGTYPMLELNGAVEWDENANGSVQITQDGNVLFTSPDGKSGWVNGDGFESSGAASGLAWFGQANLEKYGVSREGVGAVGEQFRIAREVYTPDGRALNFVPREILYAEVTAANVAARVSKVQAAGAAQGATLGEESAAIRVRGLEGTPQRRTFTGSLAEESAAIGARGMAAAPYVAPSSLTMTPIAQWRAAGAAVSSLAAQASTAVEGIISLGSALMNTVAPPRWLPPVYVAPSSLTPPALPYIAPSSLTLTPVRTTLPQPPKPYVPPSSLTQPPKQPPKPYVPPSSLTQPPKPKAPVAPTAGSPGRPGAGR